MNAFFLRKRRQRRAWRRGRAARKQARLEHNPHFRAFREALMAALIEPLGLWSIDAKLPVSPPITYRQWLRMHRLNGHLRKLRGYDYSKARLDHQAYFKMRERLYGECIP